MPSRGFSFWSAGASAGITCVTSLLSFTACVPARTALDERVDETEIRRSVSHVRGLPELSRTPVTFLSHDDFVHMLAERHRSRKGESESSSEGVGGPTQAIAAQAETLELRETIGIHDHVENHIYLRRPAEGERGGLPLSWVLAHELTHALQHQHLPLRDLAAIERPDEQLAYLALLEGDAMVTMVASSAVMGWVPPRRAISMTLRSIQRNEATRLSRVGGADEDQASPALKARLEFPYVAGTVFVGHLYRTGGFPLVNRVYSAPPRTTEQVMHPEKYLAGEPAQEVTLPVPPAGWTASLTGNMGELGAHGLVQQCRGSHDAARAAAGWGGDSFTVARHPNGAELVLWSSAWDSPEDAHEFAVALRGCYSRGTEHYVAERGDRVSAIAGFPIANAPELHAYLLALPAASPAAAPPLGAVSLVPLGTLPEVRAPWLEESRFVSPRLNVVVSLPPGYRANIDDGMLQAESTAGPPALIHLGLGTSVVTTESVGALYRTFTDDLRPLLGGARLDVVANSSVMTPLGPALQRTWRVRHNGAGVRALVIPICGSRGSVVLTQMWLDPSHLQTVNWVVDALRPLSQGAAPVCHELED